MLSGRPFCSSGWISASKMGFASVPAQSVRFPIKHFLWGVSSGVVHTSSGRFWLQGMSWKSSFSGTKTSSKWKHRGSLRVSHCRHQQKKERKKAALLTLLTVWQRLPLKSRHWSAASGCLPQPNVPAVPSKGCCIYWAHSILKVEQQKVWQPQSQSIEEKQTNKNQSVSQRYPWAASHHKAIGLTLTPCSFKKWHSYATELTGASLPKERVTLNPILLQGAHHLLIWSQSFQAVHCHCFAMWNAVKLTTFVSIFIICIFHLTIIWLNSLSTRL